MKSNSFANQRASRDLLLGGSVLAPHQDMKPEDEVVVQFGSWMSRPKSWSPDLQIPVPDGEVARWLGESVDVTYTVNGSTISPPLVVNVVAFRDGDSQLPAPSIVEAVDSKLVLNTFSGPAHARVAEWPLKWPGQRFSMQLTWAGGSLAIATDYRVKESDMGAELTFDVSRDRLDEIPNNTEIQLTCRVAFKEEDGATSVEFPMAAYQLFRQVIAPPGAIGNLLIPGYYNVALITPDMEHLYLLGEDQKLAVISTRTLKVQRYLELAKGSFVDSTLSPNGRFIFSNRVGAGKGYVIDLLPDKPNIIETGCENISFVEDSNQFVGITRNAVIVFFDESGKRIESYEGHPGFKSSVTPDGRTLYTGGPAKGLHLFDIPTRSFLTEDPIHTEYSWPLLSVSADGRYIASNQLVSGSVILDRASDTPMRAPDLKTSVESPIIFSRDSRFAYVGHGQDRLLRIHDVRANRLVATVPNLKGLGADMYFDGSRVYVLRGANWSETILEALDIRIGP
jgi:hypothetical protein